jgi:hypothetical protein
LLVDLLVLCELFLDLNNLGLQAWLLLDLGFLVGVDGLTGDKLVEGLAGVLGYDLVDLLGVGLGEAR